MRGAWGRGQGVGGGGGVGVEERLNLEWEIPGQLTLSLRNTRLADTLLACRCFVSTVALHVTVSGVTYTFAYRAWPK